MDESPFVMKKIIYIISIGLFIGCCSTGCRKFLNVKPSDKLSGNNFWKTKEDVEKFTVGMYNKVRSGITRQCLWPVGDFRCGAIDTYKDVYPNRKYINDLAKNDLWACINVIWDRDDPNYDPNTAWWSTYTRFDRLTTWKYFYQIIQRANILYENVMKVDDPSFSDVEKHKYRAEASFIRCFMYFIMVRIWGDVPYYTDAFNQEKLPRMDMIKVFQKCLKDLGKEAKYLPWTYEDPTNRAVRAMRGGAIALMMHMNMWCAGFDKSNTDKYYKATDSLGQVLENAESKDAVKLLPINEKNEIFRGRSMESLFEIPQNLNYGEGFVSNVNGTLAYYSYPEVNNDQYQKTLIVWKEDFLDKAFPENFSDKRRDFWFDETMHNTDGTFHFLKFDNLYIINPQNGAKSNDNSIIVFRYADVILLRAQALAQLDEDGKAISELNRIRDRAGAQEYPASIDDGLSLSDAIFWERSRELMGEGYYYYDLVRTGRIMNPDFCYHPMSYSAYQQRAWTWPLDRAVLDHDPKIQLNSYWQ